MIRIVKNLAYVFLASIVIGWLAMNSWLDDRPEITGQAQGEVIESLAGAGSVTP